MPDLATDLKKRDPFESVHQEAVLLLLRAADEYENRLVRLLRPYDLTPSQYNVLRILRGEGQPLPCLEIASRLIQVVPAITGLIRRLEAAGLVTRARCDRDRRVVYIDLTDAARTKLAELDGPISDVHGELIGHLDDGELADITRLLRRVREWEGNRGTNADAAKSAAKTAAKTGGTPDAAACGATQTAAPNDARDDARNGTSTGTAGRLPDEEPPKLREARAFRSTPAHTPDLRTSQLDA